MLPRLLGEVNDNDTQFTAAMKKYQDFILIGGGFLAILLVILIVSSFSSPRIGTWRYGVCKVFLERYSQYPPDLKILTAGEKEGSARIGYLLTNSYGSRESELMECFYNTAGNTVKLSRVTIDRKPLDQSMINDFNPTIPTILAQEDLDLTLPDILPTSFEDLKFD